MRKKNFVWTVLFLKIFVEIVIIADVKRGRKHKTVNKLPSEKAGVDKEKEANENETK